MRGQLCRETGLSDPRFTREQKEAPTPRDRDLETGAELAELPMAADEGTRALGSWGSIAPDDVVGAPVHRFNAAEFVAKDSHGASMRTNGGP